MSTQKVIEKVTVLVNPLAGHGHAPVAGRKGVARLRERGVAVTEIIGTDADHARMLARRAIDDGTDALVVVGGDGAISIGLQAAALSGTPVGLIPAGTGNDHAREFGIPVGDPVAAADVIADGEVQESDLARITLGDGAVVWAGTIVASGFDSLVTDRANRMSWPKGPMRYNLAMLAELTQLRPLHYRIDLDDETVEVDATLVAVGNGRSYGGGMQICPNADKTDGLLDVTVVDHGPRTRLVRLFPRVYKGTHVNLPDVQTYRSRTVRLHCEDITAYADGDRVGPLPVTIDAVPTALHILSHTPA
ncbi:MULTISPECIES: diacylglycerol kinase [unclassified Rhodococcus (in: high G+C Gram-positive bacteria)]|uniref:diacylglycerol kinase n=1 Tax=unclassified Rhodococcus (in: high G+C Gram-positive bacteria) TaxID=192944 RepID=UPI00163B34CF|nr:MULTISPECIES: diacylglycerol kinase [unclassified Rhodococcus (in: high G+C Gram-positive bacteria)]MBC2642446.1 diacylglycerol kinase [Rhodococcus sp. 3A]MBC2892811.1 diacylglycerol kinase [Rhodococcus sp. 4CII]